MAFYGATLITNTLLKVHFDADWQISLSRLQALLFLLEMEHRASTGTHLVEAQFAAHPYGPRIPSIDAQYGRQTFSPFADAASGLDVGSVRNGLLDRYCKDAENRAWVLDPKDPVVDMVHLVVARHRPADTHGLLELLREPGTPWRITWDADSRWITEDHFAAAAADTKD